MWKDAQIQKKRNPIKETMRCKFIFIGQEYRSNSTMNLICCGNAKKYYIFGKEIWQ